MNRHVVGIVLMAAVSVGAGEQDRRLLDAVKRNEMATARVLLKARVDVNARGTDGSTALSWAVYHYDVAVAELLIAAGADMNAANDYGVTALSVACQNRNTELVDRLLRGGANPNATTPSGETALMTVADMGDLALVNRLVAGGANVNVKETIRGQTALMWAAARGHLLVVEALMNAGADLHAVSTGGSTALHFAVQQGVLPIARLLLDAGANPNGVATVRQLDQEVQPFAETFPNVTPLWLAISIRNEELGTQLLEHGANANAGQYRNISPLHLAAQHRLLGLTKALIAHGANVNARTPESARPPKGGDEFLSGHRSFYIVPIGSTPYLVAAQARDARIMRALLAAGADPQGRSEDGTTPLMAAAGIGEERYRPAGPRQRTTPAQIVEAIEVALANGAVVNAVNDMGQTALHGAAAGRSSEAIRLLLEHGAEVNHKDRDGKTPVEIAEQTLERVTLEAEREEVEHGIELMKHSLTPAPGR
jgi:ankyrin repeat protein